MAVRSPLGTEHKGYFVSDVLTLKLLLGFGNLYVKITVSDIDGEERERPTIRAVKFTEARERFRNQKRRQCL